MILMRRPGVEAVAERLKTTPKRVSLWSGRFETLGLKGLDDKPGRGRKPSIPNAKAARVVTEATRPPKSKTRWSIRSMSRHASISASSVQRIWSKNDLKPHRVKTFKLSNHWQGSNKTNTFMGSVTLPDRARSKSLGTSGSRRGDDFTPRLHGRGPEGSACSC